MQVKFYGTRGSLPVPGPSTVRYGGNTTCSAVRSAAGTLVILDMGTGAFALGRELAASARPVKGHILISHTHWDHIQGVPFFAPFFRPDNEWDIHAPRGLGASLRETLSGQMQYTYFPVELEQLGATIRYHDIVEGSLTLGDIVVETQYLNHPALTLGYRLKADGATLVHALDHEPFAPSLAQGDGRLEGDDLRHAEFLADADLVIHDAQYLAEEYAAKIGWGHSTVEYVLHVARASGVRRLALAHHDPGRSDDAIDAIIAKFRPGDDRLELLAAAEGLVIDLATVRTGAASDAPVHARSHVERPAETATVRPALAGQSVLLAGEDKKLIKRLSDILRNDHVAFAVCELDRVADTVRRIDPSLIIIADPHDAAAVARAVKSVRKLEEPGCSLPIILAGEGALAPDNNELDVTDRLAGPFTDNHARTRLRAWLMRRACRWALPPVPNNELARIKALYGLNILDSPPNHMLDGIVTLAADLFDVPVVAVTLVDSERQWFKACCGLQTRETPRDESFCAHVVANPVTMVVPDTLLDSRFAENPEVAGPPHLRFYAGHPLNLRGGHCIGTLCLADIRPRQFTRSEIGRLAQLAELALHVIEPAQRPP